jgi:hypothetical protein
MVTAQLKPMFVKPEAKTNNQSQGCCRPPCVTFGCINQITAKDSPYTRAVAHSGCSPCASSTLKGHQDTPHTKALNNKASTDSPSGDLVLSVMRVSMQRLVSREGCHFWR